MALGSVWARLKAIGGGTDRQIPSIASATALVLNEDSNTFIVTGTAAITSISTTTTPIRPGRVIYLLGGTATGPAITDTAATLTGANGTISLSAALSLSLVTTLVLVQQNTGQWWELDRAANG